jgi:phenylalanyl-tRNA synthetase alpha chain
VTRDCEPTEEANMSRNEAGRDRPRIEAEAIARARALRDLTDPAAGRHAMQLVVARIETALRAAWGCDTLVARRDPVVSVADNYDRLHYDPDAVTREARYTRYVAEGMLLRTHTTALIPGLLRGLARMDVRDTLLVCPGITYRRDTIDRLHTGEPHQLDLWRVRAGPLGRGALLDMIGRVVGAALPGLEWRATETAHPYTVDGLQIDVRAGEAWVEIGECGEALPALLEESGLDVARHSGLAMGLGLDRLLMLAKGIDDIRLLRSADPRVAGQLLDLEPYRPVSRQPATRRDLSIAVRCGTTAEDIGDRVRAALGADVDALESIELLATTPYADVPDVARARIGMRPGHDNLLVRLTIRHPTRTLASAEANRLRDRVYAAVHEGDAAQWAAGEAS